MPQVPFRFKPANAHLLEHCFSLSPQAMADRKRSRSRARRPPLLPPQGIAPPTKPRPPIKPPPQVKAKSIGPGLPDTAPRGPAHLTTHRTGRPAPAMTNKQPPRYKRPVPKIMVEFAKRNRPLPSRSQLTNWADFSPYTPEANPLANHVSVFNPDGSPRWPDRYPQREYDPN